jgi:hypothetical protein
MSFHGTFHLGTPGIVRSHEVRAHEQENQVGALQIFVDLRLPFRTGLDMAVGPEIEKSFSFKQLKMGLELRTQGLVFVRITDKG